MKNKTTLIRGAGEMSVETTTNAATVTAVATANPGLPNFAGADLHQAIMSGMRWTLWLSIFSVPFSYGTSILLARLGPEVLGTYGILSIYIGTVSAFLYLGGNAIPQRFLPMVAPENRRAFFRTFGALLAVGIILWMALAILWPKGVGYLFGGQLSPQVLRIVLCLSPVYIAFYSGTASLKALLEIKTAQILDRAVPIITFVIYAAFALTARDVLKTHYHLVVWVVYFTIIALGALAAWSKLLPLMPPSSKRFFMADGFWHFTGGLQASSVLGFVNSRLDFIFVVNFGGLAALGKYYAVISLSSVVANVSVFFLDSLLPALTNMLARRDSKGASNVAHMYLRMITPCLVALSSLVVLFAVPLLKVMGQRYTGLGKLLQIGGIVATVQSLNWLAGVIFGATARPHYDAVIKVGRAIALPIIFVPLWHRYGMPGAILSWAVCEVLYQIIALVLINRNAPFRLEPWREYRGMAGTLGLVSYVAFRWPGAPIWSSAALWIFGIVMFFSIAGYSFTELRSMLISVLPIRRLAVPVSMEV